MSGLRGHGAEGVSAAGREGVNADEQHVDQQGPGVAVGHEVQGGAEDAETPQEVPARQHCVDLKRSCVMAIVWIFIFLIPDSSGLSIPKNKTQQKQM